MNESNSSDTPKRSVETHDGGDPTVAKPDDERQGSEQPQHNDDALPEQTVAAENGDGDATLPTATTHTLANGNKSDGEEPESEAETLITSPVKKREAMKRSNDVKSEEADTAPGPETAAQEASGFDDEADAPGSPDDLGVVGSVAATSKAQANSDVMEVDSDNKIDASDSLSEMSAGRESSPSSSRASSRSRAASDRPSFTSRGPSSPNPRKRKHRASSVSLPSKRQSLDGSRRKLRGVDSEDVVPQEADERSSSPKLHTHRRAVSTQSFMDGSGDAQSGRKRRTPAQLPARDIKSAKPGWDESSVSSETTSYGQNEQKRPQRGIGRSTSTPGRPPGREHKRHVNKYGFTRLAEACETGDLDLAKEWREKDPDQLELAEFAGNKPLQIAALNGNAEIVEYLIDQGCQVDCANVDKDTPLIDAAENGHMDVVGILLKAGVDPLRQNLKGQQALDVVGDDTDNATEIRRLLREAIESWNSADAKQRREEEEVQRYRAGPAKELHFMARTYENLLRLVTINDRNGVREFLDARVPVDNAVIAAAARTGDLYLMNMLLAEMTDKKRHQKAEKPMLSVLGSSHFEMVRSLTELDQFNALWTNRQGKRWSEIAAEKAGPMWKQEVELLHGLEQVADEKQKDRLSSSPVLRRADQHGKQVRGSGSKDDEGSDDEDADGDTPRQRKNGRRLMSRRDIRAVSGGRPDGESEDSESDSANAQELRKKAQASAKERRGPGRPRTKSLSVKGEDDKDWDGKQHRRRSSSSKVTASSALPSVAERVEDEKAEGEQMEIDEPVDAVEPPSQADPVQDTAKDEQDNQAREAAAVAEEQRKAQEQLKAEEARKAEEERQRLAKAEAEEQARKEAQRQREEQEAKRQEEQRQKQQAELEEAKSKYRQEMLTSLPSVLSWTLDPASDFSYEERGAVDTILERFSPIQTIGQVDLIAQGPVNDKLSLMALNVLVAPLLGKESGLQLLLPDDSLEFQGSLAESVSSQAVTAQEKDILGALLRGVQFAKENVEQDERMMDDDEEQSFQEELRQAATRLQQELESDKIFESQVLALRWVSLPDVLEQLHPALRTSDISIREDWRATLTRWKRVGQGNKYTGDGITSFFDGVREHWRGTSHPLSGRYREQVKSTRSGPFTASTTVVVSHQK